MIKIESHQDFAGPWNLFMTVSHHIRIAREAFGFGDAREVRKIVSLSWHVDTRQLETLIDRENPYTDPWLQSHGARLLLHEEEAQITLPSGASDTTVNEAGERLMQLAQKFIR
jgi:hypothetical protein